MLVGLVLLAPRPRPHASAISLRSFASPFAPKGDVRVYACLGLDYGFGYGVEDAFKVGGDLVVPKTDDGVAVLVQVLSAEGVCASLLVVLAAVQLDGQFSLGADEVDDVVVDHVLADESVTVQGSVFEVLPEDVLWIGGIVSHVSGEAFQLLSFVRHEIDDRGRNGFPQCGLAKVRGWGAPVNTRLVSPRPRPHAPAISVFVCFGLVRVPFRSERGRLRACLIYGGFGWRSGKLWYKSVHVSAFLPFLLVVIRRDRWRECRVASF